MQQPPSDAEIAFAIVFYAVILLVFLGIQALICYFMYRACSAIPENYRLTSPGAAFVLMIPLVNLVWIFIYTKNLSNSFVNLFNSQGITRDDCGEKVGMWWGICAICSVIPCLGALAGIASFVLMIIYLVKVSECRTQALAMINNPAGPGGYAAAPYKTPGSPQNPYGY
jgi:hypothetical protein